MQKIITSILISLLACTLFSCGSDSQPSGELCPDNAKGRYANDGDSEVMIDTIISPSIADSRVCPDAYPVCHATFCARCEVNEIWVTDDDQVSRCMTCEELSECHSESCETAKTRCGNPQNKCTPGCQNDELITCEGDKETKTHCPNGCSDDGKSCKEEGAKCTPGCQNDELITCEGNKETKTHCPNGCSDDGKSCKEEFKCGDNEIVSNSGCICDKSHGWIGTAGKCQCNEADGYKLIGTECKAPVDCDKDKEIYNPASGICECDAEKHLSGTAGHCTCADGYADILGECMFTGIKCEVPHTIYDPQKNRCVCDAEGHWKGTQTGCVCEDGYTEVNGVCQ